MALKLLFLLDMHEHIGGGSYSLMKFAESLAERGHETHLWGISRSLPFFSSAKSPRMHIHYRRFIPSRVKGSSRLNDLLNNYYLSKDINKLIVEKGITHVFGSFTKMAIDAVKLSKRHHIKAVNFVFESPPLMEHDLGKIWAEEYAKTKRRWEKTKEAYLESDRLIAISRLTADWCSRWLGQEVRHYVYPGIDTDYIRRIKAHEKRRQIIYVGRLYPTKNVDELIKALGNHKNPPVLKIIGGGREKKSLKRLALNLGVAVEFLGVLNDQDKFREIKKSLLMIFPSSHEGFGMPPMEALACKIPCICPDKPIFHEVYKDKLEYYKEHDIKDLSKSIRNLLAQPAYSMKRGEEGKEYIRSHFSWKKSAEKIESLLA